MSNPEFEKAVEAEIDRWASQLSRLNGKQLNSKCERAYYEGILFGAAYERDRAKGFFAVIENLDKAWWFLPSSDSGVCSTCDGGQDPNWPNEHEPHCPLEQLHNAVAAYRAGQPKGGDE